MRVAKDHAGIQEHVGIGRGLTGAKHDARAPREGLEGFVSHELHLHLLAGEARHPRPNGGVVIFRFRCEHCALGLEVGKHAIENMEKPGIAKCDRQIDALDAVRYRQAAIGDHQAVGVTHAREHTAHIAVEMSASLHGGRFMNALSSASVGMLSCAPRLVTERAPAAHPRRTASASPRSQNAPNAPVKVSPAPVVSTGLTAKATWCRSVPVASVKYAPSAPLVTTTRPGKRVSSACQPRSGWASAIPSSYSLGVINVQRAKRLSGSPTAGAGFSRKGLRYRAASSAPRSTVASGTSSCASTTSASANADSAASRSAGLKQALAPETTTMALSALHTVIAAIPVDTPGVSWTQRVATPSAARRNLSSPPNESVPTRPSMVTSAPRRAAATAWLAPFPPACVA